MAALWGGLVCSCLAASTIDAASRFFISRPASGAATTSGVPHTEEAMKKAGKTYEPVVYEGAGHGFMRAGEAPDASEANKNAREAAWKRVKGILKKV